MTPPVLMVRPVGNVPDASAQVKGPLPPVELSVVEYGTLITAAGSAVEVMTSGPNEIGSLPLPHEMANSHRNKQIRRERALFNPVINVLIAQIVVNGVRMAQSQSYRRRREINPTRRLTRRASHFCCCSTMVAGSS